ncbi:viperin family antiviral radical SAM protein [Shimia sagamensis]|uniref:S-adenosylmethionine-dependent nucleotide dehydratase n=1 Tax=Shimia sagamensis TaxID=1566352 RepID=A0ABY1NQ56_9RHOB|nr:viperin family antiviral radical SAM protein [Shimia sagamensis]SMP14827.1 radical S-adenosyl methionine domain-containing protein 2 [Shimia sagamensis]
MDELVINWHVNEACNYRCNYCYAKWTDQRNFRDLALDGDKTTALLAELWQYFNPSNKDNALRSELNWKSVRLNFAGGEPLLNTDALHRAMRIAHALGFNVSIITNGSRLNDATLLKIAPYLQWLGLSVDAIDATTNTKIGRIDRRNQLLNLKELVSSINKARSLSPTMKLKINTVVSDANETADLSPLIAEFKPEKWKVLRVLPMVSNSGTVSDKSFTRFVDRHAGFQSIMQAEDNFDMLGTYLMIDPKGRFFQNHTRAKEAGYDYSAPILDTGAKNALESIGFSAFGFAQRYQH